MAIKYAAQVQGVQEVSLRGEADLQPWSAELAALGLTPIEQAGRVGAMLSATSARFRGVRFREFSIALLAKENDTGREGWYLAHAFNSLRLFAWIERTMFSTPYYFGQVEVNAAAPAAMRAGAGEARIHAAMGGALPERRPQRRGNQVWEGPLFLPRASGKSGPPRWFYARLSGDAHVYGFVPEHDVVTVTPAAPWPVFGQLAASRFVGVEWLLRTSGDHAKSRTYDRPTTGQWPAD